MKQHGHRHRLPLQGCTCNVYWEIRILFRQLNCWCVGEAVKCKLMQILSVAGGVTSQSPESSTTDQSQLSTESGDQDWPIRDQISPGSEFVSLDDQSEPIETHYHNILDWPLTATSFIYFEGISPQSYSAIVATTFYKRVQ